MDGCLSPEKWPFSACAWGQSLAAFRQTPLLPSIPKACGTSSRNQLVLAQTLWAPVKDHLWQLEKNNKAALPSNPLRNVKTRVGTHRLFVTSGTQCQLPSLAGRAKWQNTMKCSMGLHRASQDRGYILLKKVTVCLLPNWGNFLPFSILPSIPDLYIFTLFARAHLKKEILK